LRAYEEELRDPMEFYLWQKEMRERDHTEKLEKVCPCMYVCVYVCVIMYVCMCVCMLCGACLCILYVFAVVYVRNMCTFQVCFIKSISMYV